MIEKNCHQKAITAFLCPLVYLFYLCRSLWPS